MTHPQDRGVKRSRADETRDRSAGRAERRMARDLLRLNSMVAGGRVVHQDPVGALIGLRSLLKTARKRHNRYWGDR